MACELGQVTARLELRGRRPPRVRRAARSTEAIRAPRSARHGHGPAAAPGGPAPGAERHARCRRGRAASWRSRSVSTSRSRTAPSAPPIQPSSVFSGSSRSAPRRRLIATRCACRCSGSTPRRVPGSFDRMSSSCSANHAPGLRGSGTARPGTTCEPDPRSGRAPASTRRSTISSAARAGPVRRSTRMRAKSTTPGTPSITSTRSWAIRTRPLAAVDTTSARCVRRVATGTSRRPMQMGDEKREELGRDRCRRGHPPRARCGPSSVGSSRRQLLDACSWRLTKRDRAAGERARRGVVVGGDEHAAGQRLARERRQPEDRICAQLDCLRPVRGQAGNDA